jgi:hypothetical protein
MRSHCIAGFALFCLLCTATAIAAETAPLKITVSAGKHDRVQGPVRVVLPDARGLAAGSVVALTDAKGKTLAGQIAAPSVADEASAAAVVLHFVAPAMKQGETATWTVTPSPVKDAKSFSWKDTAGQYADLLYDDRPVIRYMYEPLDPARRDQTYKMYHHVYDFAGENFLTKGPGSKFPHHRGIFFGFSKCEFDGGKADTWHCSGDAHLSHDGLLASEAGPVLGRHTVAVGWHGTGKKVFANEKRELAVYNVAGGHLIQFASRVASAGGKVKLGGDPQHAGFQYRAAAEVGEKTAKETYYLRPDGQDKPGQTRNWGKHGDTHANLPWNAMSFVTGGKRYTCVYIDHPQNPKEARYSERDYGRFGSYFEYHIEPGKELVIKYRLWVQEGEMTVEQAAALCADFAEPATVEVD